MAMNALPDELWDVVVHHCVLWDESKPDIDALLLLHRTNKHMGRTASQLLYKVFDAGYESDEDLSSDQVDWSKSIVDAFYSRMNHIFNRESRYWRKINRLARDDRFDTWFDTFYDSDYDMSENSLHRVKCPYGKMSEWLSEQVGEVDDDICVAIADSNTFLIHKLCTKWVSLAYQQEGMSLSDSPFLTHLIS